jgi:hypothetical protein
MSKLTLILDSTQLATFLECPTEWRYSFHENLTPAAVEPNISILMGTFGHALMDIYYKSKAQGLSVPQARDAAMDWLVPNDHPAFALDKLNQAIVRNRFNEYVCTFAQNDFSATSPEHVEVGFSEPIYESADRLYVLEGRLDLIGDFNNLNTVIDHKFQLRRCNLYKKSIQFRNYAMVAKKNMLVINYVGLTKGVTKDTFQRDIASFTPIEHQVWRQRLIQVYDRIADCLLSDSYPQRWDSCAGKYGHPCVFTPLCEEWDKQLIQIKKKEVYTQKPEWHPW